MLHRELGTRAVLVIPWSGVKTCSGVNVTPAVGNSAVLDIPWSGVKTCSGVNVTPGVGNSSSACYTLVRCKNLLWR